VQTKLLFINAVQRLKRAGIPEPELEVSLLLSHVLKIERTALLLAGSKILSNEQLELFEKNISRRLNREPLAYITEEKEFWSQPFKVSKDVLIPRPETEFLVETALKVLQDTCKDAKKAVNILDLGTGSGVIAVAMALELPAARVTAIDYSYKALKVARHNAKKNKVAERIDFINCNWFGGVAAQPKFDVVLSNPPYIARENLAGPLSETRDSLQPEVVNFEPSLALDGGDRGIREIRRIAVGLGNILVQGGWFFMEIGADQAVEVSAIFTETSLYDAIEVFDDYAGLPRVLQARKK